MAPVLSSGVFVVIIPKLPEKVKPGAGRWKILTGSKRAAAAGGHKIPAQQGSAVPVPKQAVRRGASGNPDGRL